MITGTVIAIAAAVIGLSALGVSIWSGVETRRHNRLSATPHLRIDFDLVPSGKVAVTISNNGFGLALIDDFAVFLDGEILECDIAAGLKTALEKLGIVGQFYAYTPVGGDSLAAGEHKELLSFALGGDRTRDDVVHERLGRIVFEVGYRSLYNEEQRLRRSAIGGG